jgi:hypothetical protein
MAQPDLVFMTPDNEAKIRQRVAPEVLKALDDKARSAAQQDHMAKLRKDTVDEMLKRVLK